MQVPKDPDKFLDSFLQRVVPQKDHGKVTVAKEIVMDLATQKKSMMRRKGKKTSKKVLSSTQRKQMKLYDIPPENLK